MSKDLYNYNQMGYLEITLTLDKRCPNRPYYFKITSESEEIEFKIANREKKIFILPINEKFSIKALEVEKPGISTHYSQQTGTVMKNKTQIDIKKSYKKQDEKTVIKGQIYWEFENESALLIPEIVSVYVLDQKEQIIQKQRVSKDAKERWSYHFILPKYNKHGALNIYTLKCVVSEDFYSVILGNNIKNVAYKPLPILLKVSVTRSIDTDNKTMLFKIQALHQEPLPQQDTLEIYGEGVKSFLPIKLKRPGIYNYHICTLPDITNGVKQKQECIDVEISIIASDLELEIESINYIKAGRFYDKDCAKFIL